VKMMRWFSFCDALLLQEPDWTLNRCIWQDYLRKHRGGSTSGDAGPPGSELALAPTGACGNSAKDHKAELRAMRQQSRHALDLAVRLMNADNFENMKIMKGVIGPYWRQHGLVAPAVSPQGSFQTGDRRHLSNSWFGAGVSRNGKRKALPGRGTGRGHQQGHGRGEQARGFRRGVGGWSRAGDDSRARAGGGSVAARLYRSQASLRANEVNAPRPSNPPRSTRRGAPTWPRADGWSSSGKEFGWLSRAGRCWRTWACSC